MPSSWMDLAHARAHLLVSIALASCGPVVSTPGDGTVSGDESADDTQSGDGGNSSGDACVSPIPVAEAWPPPACPEVQLAGDPLPGLAAAVLLADGELLASDVTANCEGQTAGCIDRPGWVLHVWLDGISAPGTYEFAGFSTDGPTWVVDDLPVVEHVESDLFDCFCGGGQTAFGGGTLEITTFDDCCIAGRVTGPQLVDGTPLGGAFVATRCP